MFSLERHVCQCSETKSKHTSGQNENILVDITDTETFVVVFDCEQHVKQYIMCVCVCVCGGGVYLSVCVCVCVCVCMWVCGWVGI